MKFSILIITLNEENYVGILLDSLVDQTYKDFEVMVVDGKSEDKTEKVVEQYQDWLDLKFKICPKRGIAFQRNYAATQASTKNLIFLDADGYLEPQFLEKLNHYIDNNQTDILTSWVRPIKGSLFDNFAFWYYNRFYLSVMKYLKPGGGGAFIYARKEVFRRVGGFSQEVIFAEDFDFIDRVCKQGFNYHLLKDPAIRTSLRRIIKEGRLNFLKKMLKGAVHFHLKGPIKELGKFTHEVGKFR